MKCVLVQDVTCSEPRGHVHCTPIVRVLHFFHFDNVTVEPDCDLKYVFYWIIFLLLTWQLLLLWSLSSGWFPVFWGSWSCIACVQRVFLVRIILHITGLWQTQTMRSSSSSCSEVSLLSYALCSNFLRQKQFCLTSSNFGRCFVPIKSMKSGAAFCPSGCLSASAKTTYQFVCH